MSKNQKPNLIIKNVILKTLKEQQPETASQLIRLVNEKTKLSEEEIMNQLNQLESEGKIHFNVKQEFASVSFGTYLSSSVSSWYWAVITMATVTTIAVFMISQDLYPMVYLRNVLGVIFVLFLPGYVFLRALFPEKVQIEMSDKNSDTVELVVLSVGISIALASFVGLILYFSPLGIGLTSMTLSLLVFNIGLATGALVRDYQAKSISIP